MGSRNGLLAQPGRQGRTAASGSGQQGRPGQSERARHTFPMKSEPGPPMTPGNAATARVRLICGAGNTSIRGEPDPAEQAQRYGAEMSVLDLLERMASCEFSKVEKSLG